MLWAAVQSIVPVNLFEASAGLLLETDCCQMPFSRSWIVCATLSPPTLTSPASFFPGADRPGTVVPSPPAAHSPAWLRSQLGWERRSEWPNGRRRPALDLRRG